MLTYILRLEFKLHMLVSILHMYISMHGDMIGPTHIVTVYVQ